MVPFGTQSYSKCQHFTFLGQKPKIDTVCFKNPKLNLTHVINLHIYCLIVSFIVIFLVITINCLFDKTIYCNSFSYQINIFLFIVSTIYMQFVVI